MSASAGGTMTIKPDTRTSGKIRLSFICSNRNGNKMNCDNAVISSDIVLNKVLESLKQECQKIVFNKEEIEETFATVEKELDVEKYKIQEKIDKTGQQIKKLELQIKAIYEDKLNEIISVDDFLPIYQAKKDEKEKLINEQQELKKELEQQENAQIVDYGDLYKFANDFLKLEKPTKEVITNLVENITVSTGRKIKIKYKFSKV